MRFAIGDEVQMVSPSQPARMPVMRVAELGIRLVWCEWWVGDCKMAQWFVPDDLVKVRTVAQ